MTYYYFVDKKRVRQGPFSYNDLKSYEIKPDTLVWCKGMKGRSLGCYTLMTDFGKFAFEVSHFGFPEDRPESSRFFHIGHREDQGQASGRPNGYENDL